MSKAFLRESDYDALPETPRPASLLAPGTRNLMTEEGASCLRAELSRLVEQERPSVAGSVADPDTRRRLSAIDQRIRHLQTSLASADVVPFPGPGDIVRFGSSVTIREPNGERATYRIVGVDETDCTPEGISWQSPMAKVLLNARIGDRVTLSTARGSRELEVLSIE